MFQSGARWRPVAVFQITSGAVDIKIAFIYWLLYVPTVAQITTLLSQDNRGLCRPLLLLCQWRKCAFQLWVHPRHRMLRGPSCLYVRFCEQSMQRRNQYWKTVTYFIIWQYSSLESSVLEQIVSGQWLILTKTWHCAPYVNVPWYVRGEERWMRRSSSETAWERESGEEEEKCRRFRESEEVWQRKDRRMMRFRTRTEASGVQAKHLH